ncbi:hypothetical protein D3C75_1004430 [compost metagenome]
MPVRQTWPSSVLSSIARLRTGIPVSGANGLAPPMAKRPTTGTRCWLKARAVDRLAACPLAWK